MVKVLANHDLHRVTENDRKLIAHSLNFMEQALAAAGGRDIWRQEEDTCHLNGTARMGDDSATSVVKPIVAAGISPTCGYATARCFPRSAA